MNRLLHACVILLLLLCAVASASLPLHLQSSAGSQNPQPVSGGEQELAEAARLNKEAVEMFNQGRFDEALTSVQRALAIRQKYLRENDPLLLDSLFNLAEILFAKRKYDDAVSLYKRILSAEEGNAGTPDPKLTTVLDRLAFIYYLRGDFAKAETSYLRALDVTERLYGAESAEAASAAYQVAHFYRLRGKTTQAETFYNRALPIQAKLLGPEHALFKRTLNGYYCMLVQSDQIERTRDLQKRFEAMLENAGLHVADREVLNGRAISLPRPIYPPSARASRMGGIIVIEVEIDETGRVTKANDLCGGFEPLIEAARESALHAQFSPTKLSGQPVKVTGTIIYRFVQ